MSETSSQNITIRPIRETDDPALASLIRATLLEFGANHKGTVYDDPRTNHLSEGFREKRSAYYVVELKGEIIGGGGIYPTEGLPDDTCELVKMYLLPKARGLGIGRTLIEKNIALAKEFGFKNIYLETMPELKKAMSMYEKFGWKYLNGPMGNSGHTGCSLWMIRKVEPLSC